LKPDDEACQGVELALTAHEKNGLDFRTVVLLAVVDQHHGLFLQLRSARNGSSVKIR
jgi:hypothetical protein